MAILCLGATQPLLIAGIIRSAALALALGVALAGSSVVGIAATGILGEAASLLYVAWRVDQERPGLARSYLSRMMLLPAAVLISWRSRRLCRLEQK